ncbi:hypothetical protein [Nonomuraea sp. NPDC049480]|uniref:hypothetical protein n=1 Tax=Nonomuraea sp. NPDC049480 TaxID=3364353 RepID=UPI00378A61B8
MAAASVARTAPRRTSATQIPAASTEIRKGNGAFMNRLPSPAPSTEHKRRHGGATQLVKARKSTSATTQRPPMWPSLTAWPRLIEADDFTAAPASVSARPTAAAVA